jgi:hypothetical protein
MLVLLIIKATITVKNKYKELNFKILIKEEKKLKSYINCTSKTVTKSHKLN